MDKPKKSLYKYTFLDVLEMLGEVEIGTMFSRQGNGEGPKLVVQEVASTGRRFLGWEREVFPSEPVVSEVNLHDLFKMLKPVPVMRQLSFIDAQLLLKEKTRLRRMALKKNDIVDNEYNIVVSGVMPYRGRVEVLSNSFFLDHSFADLYNAKYEIDERALSSQYVEVDKYKKGR